MAPSVPNVCVCVCVCVCVFVCVYHTRHFFQHTSMKSKHKNVSLHNMCCCYLVNINER